VIAWQIEQRVQTAEDRTETIGHDTDLRRMSGAELSRHLAGLGT
jgi:hypothetical protein